MKIRINTLWRIPVYYLIVSSLCFRLLVWLYSFCVVKTVDANGVTHVSSNPVANTLIGISVLIIVLVIGGFWLCRTMTRLEVAVSAGLLSALYLLWSLFPIEALVWPMIYATSLNVELASLLSSITGQAELSAMIGCFTPMLFVFFGKKSIS